MNGLPRHPGIEELAEFRAGVTDGARGDQLAAHLAECPECSSASDRLGHLPTVLASIPMPSIPADIEARVMAAIAAEAGARCAPHDKVRHLPGPASASADPAGRPLQSRPTVLPGAHPRTTPGWRSQSLTATVGAMVAAAACLVLAFIGFRLSDQGHPATASAARGGPVRTGASPAAGSTASGGIIVPRQNTTSPAFRLPRGEKTPFPVLISTADFRGSTFQAQVRQQLTAMGQARGVRASGNESQSGAAGSAGPTVGLRVSPSKSLVGCVARLDGGIEPTLVEEASYQSTPAYVIATPTHAWAVARDCSPTRLAILASVVLSPVR